jgi:hypothetical protein
MNRFVFFLFLIVALPLAADDQETIIEQLALKGIDLATNLHYKEADAVFEEIVKLEPGNPRGYFLRSATYFWMYSEDIKNEEVGNKFPIRLLKLPKRVLMKMRMIFTPNSFWVAPTAAWDDIMR